MKTSSQKIENYLKDFLQSEPAISKKETDKVADDILIMLKEYLSDNTLNRISDIMSPAVAKALLLDYHLTFKG